MRAFVFGDESLKEQAGRFVWLAIDTEKEINAKAQERLPTDAGPPLLVIHPTDEPGALRGRGAALRPQGGRDGSGGRDGPVEGRGRRRGRGGFLREGSPGGDRGSEAPGRGRCPLEPLRRPRPSTEGREGRGRREGRRGRMGDL